MLLTKPDSEKKEFEALQAGGGDTRISLFKDMSVASVIVDAASEYDLRLFLEQGADLIIYSGHKLLGGPTSSAVA